MVEKCSKKKFDFLQNSTFTGATGSPSMDSLPKSVSISKSSADNNGGGMNRLNKLSGISISNNSGASMPMPKPNSRESSPMKSNGENKGNPLSRLAHLNVSISGSGQDKPGNSISGSPQPPPLNRAPNPQRKKQKISMNFPENSFQQVA